jgi:hypothetical protein
MGRRERDKMRISQKELYELLQLKPEEMKKLFEEMIKEKEQKYLISNLRHFKAEDRKRNIFPKILNGSTYVELSKECGVTPATIRINFLSTVRKIVREKKLEEEIYGDKKSYDFTLANYRTKKEILLKAFQQHKGLTQWN